MEHKMKLSSKRPRIVHRPNAKGYYTNKHMMDKLIEKLENTMSNCNGSGKNAYEIRLAILELAVGQADSAYYTQLDKARTDAGEKGTWDIPEDNRVRQALRIAKKLYAFVEGDKSESDEG